MVKYRQAQKKIRVGITMGDPSGVGPLLIVKALARLHLSAEFVVIGDKKVYEAAGGKNGGKRKAPSRFIDVGNVPSKAFTFGKVKGAYGRASLEYIDCALQLIRSHAIDCLVTCPVSKQAIGINSADFTGQTEYLARAFGIRDFAMLLFNRKLKIVPLTRHLALAQVPRRITTEALAKTIVLTYISLRGYFGVSRPRLVVAGLNPHASDGGLFGSEERRVIKPALLRAKRIVKVSLAGPVAADAAVAGALAGAYDCVIAMYHDQALIPLKATGGYSGVNMTLGLPFVRTSPLHGTAFDIARSPRLADPRSLCEAIEAAVACTLRHTS
jgi:4-hydroxythreonine-4-phosphate dehydrogenase